MIDKFNINDYASAGKPVAGRVGGRTSLWDNIPIEFLQVTKVVLAHLYPGQGFRYRWRGSRKNDYGRTRTQRRQDCTREFATHFSVYWR